MTKRALRSKTPLLNAILATCTFMLGLGLLEGFAAAGVVDYRLVFRNLGHQPWANPLNRTDPELLHLHRKGLLLQGEQHGDIGHYAKIPNPKTYKFRVRIDDRGFRNPQTLKRAHIAVLGDSFIESVLTPQDSLLTTTLGQKTGPDRPVVNLGQIWYAPQQAFVTLKRFALPLRPKVIVWAFYGGNDLTDFRRYEKTIATWPEESARLHSFWMRSFIRNLLSIAKRALRPPKLPRAHTAQCPQEGGVGPMYFHYPQLPLNQDDRRALTRTVELMAQAAELSAAQGATLAVAYVPTKFQVYGELCTVRPEDQIAGWRPNGLADSLREALQQRSPAIPFVDLSGPLKDAVERGEQVYLRDDTHWSAAGDRAAGLALHAFLVKSGLL